MLLIKCPAMTTASSKPLHHIGDNGAEEYINESLTDNDNDVIKPLLSNITYPSKQSNDSNSYRNRYYIQQSYDETINKLQQQDSTDRCGLSPVRRMFLLLSLFDVLLAFLLWIIYLQLLPGEFKDKLKHLKLDVRKTFLDVVILSLIRSFLILTVYSCLFKVKKWYTVALTTTASTVYLLVKVFKVEFSDGQPLNYLMIIFSFVICWCEAWHFDFQVIPRERENIISTAPDWQPQTVEQLPSSSECPTGYGRAFSRGAKSSAFFTPYAGSVYRNLSPISDDDTDSSLSNLSEELNAVQERDRKLIRVGKDTVHMVFRMLYINDGWVLHKEEDNITVHARYFEGVGKVFKLEALLDVPHRLLDKLFWEDLDSQPTWNASVKECQIGIRLNKRTDIVYTIAAEAGAGIIASRDFVMLRRRKKKGPLTILSSVSIETDLYPVKKSIIRGTNGPGGWIFREIEGEPNKTEFIWLLNTELKGWIPQSLVEQSLAGVMVDTTRDIRDHTASLPIA